MRSYVTLLVLVTSILMVSCASNKNKSEGETSKIPLQVPPTVGQILVKLEVTEAFDGSKNQIKAKVNEVLAYGSSTDLLSPESVLTLKIPDDESFSSLTKMKSGDVFEASIEQQRIGLDSKTGSDVWNIVELKN